MALSYVEVRHQRHVTTSETGHILLPSRVSWVRVPSPAPTSLPTPSLASTWSDPWTTLRTLRRRVMEKRQYSCIKCSGTSYKAGEIRTTGSGISRFLNLQNQKFATLSCTGCGYTELYRLDASGAIGNIFDILSN